jgi:hypothetical protein
MYVWSLYLCDLFKRFCNFPKPLEANVFYATSPPNNISCNRRHLDGFAFQLFLFAFLLTSKVLIRFRAGTAPPVDVPV